jgi:predicted PurR-regulated permease PerM
MTLSVSLTEGEGDISLSEGPSSKARLDAAIFYGVVLLLGYLVFRIFQPFLVSLAWAAVLVVVFYPSHSRLQTEWGKTRAATASTAAATLIIILPALLVAGAFVRQGLEAARSIQQELSSGHLSSVNHAWLYFQQRFPSESPADLAGLLRQGAEKIASSVASELGTVVRHIATFVFDLAVTLFAMFYLFRDGEDVLARLRDLLPFEEAHRERMIGEARDLIFASVTSSLVAAAIHGVVGGGAFAVAGVNAPIFWGVMMAFCSLIPVIGSSIIWLPASIWLMAQGRVGRGIFVVVVCAGLVGLVDNIVRPWLISGRARLGGLVIFISVLGGISVFGVLGVVLGPIVVATAASVLDIYTERGLPRHRPAKPASSKPHGVLE